ncbi:MAG TPA: preprotein translocase subunit SecG [Candidatus Babeliales bacterium]|nr:preprotein translocase subunit SecG [Candidatus Babeliales bacterium]
MLYEFLLTLYLIDCFFLVLIILMQKGKSGLGLGGLGGGAQMLFGGSGGQDLFQKITWILGSIFMAGAMVLSLMKSSEYKKFKYLAPSKVIIQAENQQIPAAQDSEQSN